MNIATTALLLASASAVSLRSEKNKLGECPLIKDKDACCASAQCGWDKNGACINIETMDNKRGEWCTCEGKGEEADVSGGKKMGDEMRAAGAGTDASVQTAIIRYPALPAITPPCTGTDCQPEENPIEGDKERKGPGAIAKRAWSSTNTLKEGGFLRPLIKSINALEAVGKSLNEKLKALRMNHIANQASLATAAEAFEGTAKQDYQNRVKVANMFSDEITKWRTIVLKTKFNFENYNKKMLSLEESATKQLTDFGTDVTKQDTELKETTTEFTAYLQKITDHHKKIEDLIAKEKGKEGDAGCKKENELALESTMETGPVYSVCKKELNWLSTKGVEKIKDSTDLHAESVTKNAEAKKAVDEATETVSKAEQDLEKAVAEGVLKIQEKEKEMIKHFKDEVAAFKEGKTEGVDITTIKDDSAADPESSAAFISLSESKSRDDDVVETNPATKDFEKLNQQVNAIDASKVDGNVDLLNTDLYSSGMTHVDTWVTKLKDHLDVLKGYYKYYQVGAAQKDKKFRTQHEEIRKEIVLCSKVLLDQMMALKNNYRKLLFALSKFQKSLDDTSRYTTIFKTDLKSIHIHKKVCWDLRTSGYPTFSEAEIKDCSAADSEELQLDKNGGDVMSFGDENLESYEADQNLADMMALYTSEASAEE